jgi:hypothetical protein
MKTKMTCGCPTTSERDGAIPSSSIHCPRCGAPISLATQLTSLQPKEAINPKPVTHYRKQYPTSIMTDDIQSMNSSQLSTEQVSPTKSYNAESVDIKSEHKMETEVNNQKPEAKQEDKLQSPEERDEVRRQTLSRQGFVVQEDAHGLRLSGVASRPGGLSSQLSPYDVVRLAAELEGGIVPVEQRKRCPKCDAVVNPGDKHCQWCSETL